MARNGIHFKNIDSKYKDYKLESWEIESFYSCYGTSFNKPRECKGWYDLKSKTTIDEENFKQFSDKVLILKDIPKENVFYNPSSKTYLDYDNLVKLTEDDRNNFYRCIFMEDKRFRIDEDFIANDLQYLSTSLYSKDCRDFVWKDDDPNYYLQLVSHGMDKSNGFFSNGKNTQYDTDFQRIGFESLKSAVDFCNKIFKGKYKVSRILKTVESDISLKNFDTVSNYEFYKLKFTGGKTVKTGYWHREHDDVDGDTYDVDETAFVGISATITKKEC